MSDLLNTERSGADLPKGEPAKVVYTEDQVIELIKKDRATLIEYIEENLVMGVAWLFDKVPIKLQ